MGAATIRGLQGADLASPTSVAATAKHFAGYSAPDTSVNGVPGHASHRMLTDILRDQLHFQGVVISDWQDVENLITKYHVATDHGGRDLATR